MVENGAAASRLLPTPPSAALVAATADYTASPISGISSTAAITAVHSP